MRKVRDGNSDGETAMSDARRESVQRMLTAAKKMADGGKSPRARGIEKVTEALRWIYIWGWTTSVILGHVTGTVRGIALVKRMEKNGWIKRVPIRIASHFRIVPCDVVTITHEGIAELTTLLGELPRTTKSPWIGRVPKKDLIHDLLVQQLTLEYMGRIPGANLDPVIFQEHGLVKEFLTPLHPLVDTGESKKPDAIWGTEDGCTFAVEVELSPKWDRELDQFVAGHLQLQTKEQNAVWGLVVFFTSERTAKRYRQAMLPGAQVQPWKWFKEDRKWSRMMITDRDVVGDQFMAYTVVLPNTSQGTTKGTDGCTGDAPKEASPDVDDQ